MINFTKLIAAILVLLALALGGYAWFLSRQPAPVAAQPTAAPQAQVPAPDAPLFPVVVAARAMPVGEPIAADALRVVQLPINPQGGFRETAPIVGRVPVVDLGEGTPLLESQLVSGLALRIGEGERAVAVKADEVMGVGHRVRPGDFVDIFFVLKSDNREIDRSQVRLLLARKRVLAYGSASVDGAPSAKGSSNGNAQAASSQQARTAVLAVPVDEVNRLALAEQSGRLLLALRNPDDLQAPDPRLFADLPTALQPVAAGRGQARTPLQGLDEAQAGLTVADLASGGQGPRPAAAPAARTAVRPGTSPSTATPRTGTQVEVIRGDRRETLQY